jgi:hypothetical protein
VNSDFAKISGAIWQVLSDLRETMGISAWIMLSLLMLSAIFLGYFVMRRLLRQRVDRSRRRFVQKRRIPSQHLARRRILKYR